MNKVYVCFPNFKMKALTLSYDDGVRQDKRLISIMQKYGLKGTFNINSGLFDDKYEGVEKGRMTVKEALELYNNSGMEVAVHGYKHFSLARVEESVATLDVIKDRDILENLFGKIVKGMAYANGSYSDNVVEILKKCGINYSRTTISTENFDIPTDWLRLSATCHHNNSHLMELAQKFVDEEPFAKGKYFWEQKPLLFYLWGHSYEFDDNNNWNVIEEFAEFVGNREDIWYATNGEIYDYLKASDRLEFSADGKLAHNPTATTLYVSYRFTNYVINPGETVNISK